MRRATGVLLAGLVLVVGACSPKMTYDPFEGLLGRDDGAFDVPMAGQRATSWQVEVPGVGGAPKRYPFDYDVILYRLRPTVPGAPPDVILVLSARPYPEHVREAPSLPERNALLVDQIKRWLGDAGFGDLARDELFTFDGRTLVTTRIDANEELPAPGVGAAYLFGVEFVLQALYEVYPASRDAPMPADELRAALEAVAVLLADTRVR